MASIEDFDATLVPARSWTHERLNENAALKQERDALQLENAALKQKITELETPAEPPAPAPVGIWTSPAEIMARPITGKAWEALKKIALGEWMLPDLGDNDNTGDVATTAGAIYAVRMNDSSLRSRVAAQLRTAINYELRSATNPRGLTRTLELSRGLAAYVIAADIIGFREPEFMAWVTAMVTFAFPKDASHSGMNTLLLNATRLGFNWGGMGRQSLAAASLYLDRADWLQMAINAHKQYIGLPVPGVAPMQFTETTWNAGTPEAGVNVKGATRNGKNVSGVLGGDWYRGSANFVWPPVKTGYMWEGLQGLTSTAVMLHRAGVLPFHAGDNAVVRALNMLYGMGEAAANVPRFVFPAEGDDCWIPHIVNHYGGSAFPVTDDIVPGKGVGFGQWLYGTP